MSDKPHAPPGILRPVDVAALWTREARKTNPDREPIKVPTVWAYAKESRIAGGRYLHNPMPAPQYLGGDKNSPWWPNDAITRKALRDWWHGRASSTGLARRRTDKPPRSMHYTDAKGNRQKLTAEQATYLDLARRGFDRGHGGLKSTRSARLLHERGLIVLDEFLYRDRGWRIVGRTKLGDQVDALWKARQ